MGKQIHLSRINELFDKSPVVDFKSIERVVGSSKKSNYAKLLVHNLLSKGKIKKIGKGVYTKHNDISLVVFSFSPAYLGLQDALSHHSISEQETVPIILTTRKVRRGIRKFLGGNVLVRNINKKYFFGFEYAEYGGFCLPYSDLEKTFIDMIIFNQRMDKDVLKRIKKRVNVHKLNSYLIKYPKNVRNKIKSFFS